MHRKTNFDLSSFPFPVKGRWVAKLNMEMGGQVVAYYGGSLGSNPDISQKYKMGDILKGVAKTL
jgi:hypothetical protein